MKKLFVILFIIPFSFLKAQVSVVVEQPELNILYSGYNNIIIPAAEGYKDVTISAAGSTISPTTFQGKKGYIINPDPGMRIVTVSASGKDSKGKNVSFGSTQYKVKRFPQPLVYNEYISKTTGAEINVGFDLTCPIDQKFEVLSIGISDKEINGSVISPDIVKDFEIGKLIGVTISVMNSSTGSRSTINCALKITN
jgi:hypothetical protein